MSLSLTKPSYTECIPTEQGWVDSKTGELLVAIKNLKTRLEEEDPMQYTKKTVKTTNKKVKAVADGS